jgi:hypothetical protein
MPKYYCECCKYTTVQKANYERHLQTKKHKLASERIQMSSKTNEMSHKTNKCHPSLKKHICKYCTKEFKYRQGLSKHIKYHCKKSKDDDLLELVMLLNEQNATLQKKIDKLTQKLQIKSLCQDQDQDTQHSTQHTHQNHTNSHNHNSVSYSNNNNTYHIHILNYDKTDYSHLTERDYVKCISDCNHCVKTLIEKVHFNDKKPENKNIHISNIKNGYAMVYKDDKWQLVKRKEQIDDLYEYNEVVLETWYKENKEKMPELMKSFERYLKNKDNDEDDVMLNNIKEQILLLLYNNRLIEN